MKQDTLTLKTRHTTHENTHADTRTHTDTLTWTHLSPHRYDYVTNVISALSHPGSRTGIRDNGSQQAAAHNSSAGYV